MITLHHNNNWFILLTIFLIFLSCVIISNAIIHGPQMDNASPLSSEAAWKVRDNEETPKFSFNQFFQFQEQHLNNLKERTGIDIFQKRDQHRHHSINEDHVLVLVQLQKGWKNEDMKHHLPECFYQKRNKNTEQHRNQVMIINRETFFCRIHQNRLVQIHSVPGIRSVAHWHPMLKTNIPLNQIQQHFQENQEKEEFNPSRKIGLVARLEGDQAQLSSLQNQTNSIFLQQKHLYNRASFEVVSPKKGILRTEGFVIQDVVDIVTSFESVVWIEHFVENTLSNQYSHVLMQHGKEASNVDQTPIWDQGVRGSNQVITVMDSGLDWDHCFFAEPDQSDPPMESFDSNRRKVIGYYKTNSDVIDSDGVNGHGTHVAGTVAGRIPSNHANYQDLHLFNGMAPDSKILFWSLEVPSGGLATPNDFAPVFDTLQSANSYIHTNSWGSTLQAYISCSFDCDCFWGPWAGDLGKTPGNPTDDATCQDNFGAPCCYANAQYNSDSEMLDDSLNEYDDMILLFAASNDGSISQKTSISSQAAAKNTLVVGSSNTVPDNFDDTAEYTDLLQEATRNGYSDPSVCCSDGYSRCCASTWQNSYTSTPRYTSTTVSQFSSRGPTLDGRIRPDVVAPGHVVFSAHSDGDTNTNQCGTMSPRLDNAAAILKMSGTSMATPGVAGAAGLVREYYTQGFYASGDRDPSAGITPSGMLIKATIIHSAQPIDLAIDGDGTQVSISSRPNEYYGYGLVTLDSVLTFSNSDFDLFVYDSADGINDQSVDSWTVTPSSGGSLRVTLTWYDPPATSTNNMVINKLNLQVDDQTETREDVTKQIEVDVSSGTSVDISVIGNDVTSGPQKYALVMTYPSGSTIVGPGVSNNPSDSSSSPSTSSSSSSSSSQPPSTSSSSSSSNLNSSSSNSTSPETSSSGSNRQVDSNEENSADHVFISMRAIVLLIGFHIMLITWNVM